MSTPNPAYGSSIDLLSIHTMRCLAMDAVQKANSGHPGTPVSLSPIVYNLYQNYLRYDPADAAWPDRDRFVLSVGHASLLLYSILHLTQVKQLPQHGPAGLPAVSLDDIKKFRQLGSKTPGHPESHLTTGVETTTGPLGQGVANSVGMAIAQKWLANYFNRPGFDIFTHRIYALCGDGCMMEGVSNEAGSLAGHLKLNNLCWIYDSNRITIEGSTSLTFTEDTAKRLEALGWNVLHVTDANDLTQLNKAIETFQKTTDKPTFVVANSVIAWGVPGKEGSHTAHGEPLGTKPIAEAKKLMGFDPEKTFEIPDGVYENFANGIGKRGKELSTAWHAKFAEYTKAYPELAKQLELLLKHELPEGWEKGIPAFSSEPTEDPKNPGVKKPAAISGREASGKVLNAVAKSVPWLIGGSADLAPSTKTLLTFEGAGNFQPGTPGGRNFHWGVREHAMGSIINGMALSGVRPYGAGFLIFSDYGRPPFRLASLMGISPIYVFTHDSIGVGEDGPTHQPIEQLSSLRAIPDLYVFRPGDANEVAESWKVLMKLSHNPALMVVSRQDMPILDRSKYAPASGAAKGGYVLADAPNGKPQVILIATGTEVGLAVEAYEKLKADGIAARVVSMPCTEVFDKQDEAYKESVLPKAVTARVAVEMASPMCWYKYVGTTGAVVGMKTFGASAPLKDLLKHFGFTVEKVVTAVKDLLK
ncbi:transketolase [Telmatocola sphagniphila]|uniref:transketolase n=1 Tax=Telmatocola sphagniphila TaxID=1123043 RepID=UPI001FE8BDF4|nr:transketolase [Telmatocola sphagniphila]